MNILAIFRTSILRQQMASYLVIALVPSVILTWIISSMANYFMGQSVQRNLFVLADTKSAAIESYATAKLKEINSLSRSLIFADATIELGKALKDNDGKRNGTSIKTITKEITPTLNHIVDSLKFKNVMILDVQHEVLFNLRSPLNMGAWLKTGPMADSKLAKAANRVSTLLQPEFSDFEVTADSKSPAAFILGPIYDKARIIGLMVFQLDEQDLIEIVTDYTGMGETGQVLIGTRAGMRSNSGAILVAPTRRNENAAFKTRVQPHKTEISPMVAAVEGGRGYGITHDETGRHIVAVWMYVPSFHWGLVIDQDYTEAFALNYRIRLLGGSLLFATTIVSIMFARWASKRQSDRVVSVMNAASGLAMGDWSSRAPVQGEDELASLASSFNLMAEKLEESDQIQSRSMSELASNAEKLEQASRIEARTRITLKSTAVELSEAGSRLVSAADDGHQTAVEQAASVNEVVATVEQIRAMAQQNTEKADTLGKLAGDSTNLLIQSVGSIRQIVASMIVLRDTVNENAREISTLTDKTRQIDQITSSVNEIADQSKLLALNATIEAAKAGEQGKGFAVVAAEVRTLAEQSKTANTRIKQMLNDIRKAAESTVIATEKGVSGVDQTMDLTRSAGDLIERLVVSLKEATVAVGQISNATRQQYTGIDQINQTMREFQQSTRQLTQNAKQSQESATLLHDLSTDLLSLTEVESEMG